MSSSLKTALVAGTIALAVSIFAAAGAAQAGGRHHLPVGPYGAYLPGPGASDGYDADDYDCDDCRVGARYGLGSDVDDAVEGVKGLASEALGADVGDLIDDVLE